METLKVFIMLLYTYKEQAPSADLSFNLTGFLFSEPGLFSN